MLFAFICVCSVFFFLYTVGIFLFYASLERRVRLDLTTEYRIMKGFVEDDINRTSIVKECNRACSNVPKLFKF